MTKERGVDLMYERSLPCWWVEWPPTASPSMPTICPDKTWNEFLKNMGRWVYIWLFNNNHGWFVYTEIGRLSEEEGDFYVRGCFSRIIPV